MTPNFHIKSSLKKGVKWVNLIVVLCAINFESIAQNLRLGLPLGHVDKINAASVSPDEKFYLTASGDRTTKVFDIESGAVIYSFSDHLSEVFDAVFSPDMKYVATASFDGKVRGYSLETGELEFEYLQSSMLKSLKFSEDSKTLLIQRDYTNPIIFDVEKQKAIKSKTLEDCGECYLGEALFIPSKNEIIVSLDDDYTHIINYLTGKERLQIPVFSEHIEVDSSGEYAAFKGSDSIFVYRLKDGKKQHSFALNSQRVSTYGFIPGESVLILILRDGNVKSYNYQTGVESQILKSGSGYEHALSKDGKQLIAYNKNHYRIYSMLEKKLEHEGYSEVLLNQYGSPQYAFSPAGNYIVISKAEEGVLVKVRTGNTINLTKGHTVGINSIVYNNQRKSLVCTNENGHTNITNLEDGKARLLGERYGGRIQKIIFSPNGNYYAKLTQAIQDKYDWKTHNYSYKIFLNVYRTNSNSEIFTKKYTLADESETLKLNFKFHSIKDELWIINDEGVLTKIDLTGEKIKEYQDTLYSSGKSPYYPGFEFSSDGKLFAFETKDSVYIRDLRIGKIVLAVSVKGYVAEYHFSNDNQFITLTRSRNVSKYNCYTGKKIIDVNHPEDYVAKSEAVQNNMFLIIAGDGISILNPKTGKYIHKLNPRLDILDYQDYTPDENFQFFDISLDQERVAVSSDSRKVEVFKIKSGKKLFEYNDHWNTVSNLFYTQDGQFLITSSYDGSFIIYDANNGRLLLRQFIFDGDPSKWVHVNGDGLFDASDTAMNEMKWIRGLEVIDFSQLKDRYWVPGLWSKVMNREPLPNVKSLDELKMQPLVNLKQLNKDSIQIKLTRREGGYGNVTLLINGKEVSSDVRGKNFNSSKGEQSIKVSVKDHPYLKSGKNRIEVKAKSADGFIEGKGVILEYYEETKTLSMPQFYGVIVGVSEYENPHINLKYPANDAAKVEEVFRQGAQNLFGPDRTHIYKFTSETANQPNRENIREAFKTISKTAKSEDIIFIYLSGHGITSTGENADFHFLTKDATAVDKETYRDPVILERKTIATSDLIDWLKDIAALKQVMIIDACGSGKAVENLIAMRDIDGTQRKAIDRMKDRTGTFIISGCAADAVSYEASQYEMGILTYSIIKTLKDNKLNGNIDVLGLMNFAREDVPNLAGGLGGIQEPQMLIPSSGSFDIGILKAKDLLKIHLNNEKTIFIQSVFLDALEIEDKLELAKKIDLKLEKLSNEDELIQFNPFATREVGCQIAGVYSVGENKISASLKTLCPNTVAEVLEVETPNEEEFIDQVILRVKKELGLTN